MSVISIFARSLLKFAKFLNLVAQFVCYRLLELIVVVIVMQVILRFGFNSPTKWSEEVALISLVWFGMLAAAICVQRDTHVSITFFYDLLPNRGRFALELIIQLLIGSFCLDSNSKRLSISCAYWFSKTSSFSVTKRFIIPISNVRWFTNVS